MSKLLIATFCLLTFPAVAANQCTIVAGQGCGDLKVEKSKRSDVFRNDGDEKRYHDAGFDMSFGRDDILDTIVVDNRRYQTDLGLSVGDDEEKVRRIYGAPQKIRRLTLSKGGEPIGFVGDRTLVYPGIWFVISKDKVWAIMVLAK